MTIRTVPASDKHPGLTEITINNRTIACIGTGKHVEKAIRAFAAKSEKGEK